ATAPFPPRAQQPARDVDDQRQKRQQQTARQRREDRGGSEHGDRCLYLPALPKNLDPAGMIGEENRRGDERRDECSTDNGADHDGWADFTGASDGAAPGVSDETPRRATSSSCKCVSAASAASRCCAISSHD